MKDSITKEIVLNHSIDGVWNSITNAKSLATWWFEEANFKAKKGYQYIFSSPHEGCVPIIGEVLSADPYALVYTWIVQGTNVVTTVSWKLEASEQGTKLILEHSGISKYAGDTAVAMFNSFNGGWTNCMVDLANHLEHTNTYAG